MLWGRLGEICLIFVTLLECLLLFGGHWFLFPDATNRTGTFTLDMNNAHVWKMSQQQ